MLNTKLEAPKTANIVVRVLEEDKEFFKEWVARNTDMNMSEFIRESMSEKIDRFEAIKKVNSVT